jgi:hypothetical protein
MEISGVEDYSKIVSFLSPTVLCHKKKHNIDLCYGLLLYFKIVTNFKSFERYVHVLMETDGIFR